MNWNTFTSAGRLIEGGEQAVARCVDVCRALLPDTGGRRSPGSIYFGEGLADAVESDPARAVNMGPAAGEVTELLRAWSSGDRSVEDRLFAMVLPDLHKLARYMMGSERQDHSLQPTALLNEVYIRLVGARERDWESRKHFFAIAARAMRHLLIDHARGRPKGAKVPIEGLEEMLRGRDEQLELGVAINALLDEMNQEHPEWCSVIELKFFAGFTDDETAAAMGVPLRTMQRQFGDARQWLYERLESQPCRKKPNSMS